jgi:nitronate monooxygenase
MEGHMSTHPPIIQGGMGAGVSNWELARAVSRLGQLGVVSGTALDQILVRRLQDGDPGGHMRFALDHFPVPEMADRIWQEWYLPGGRKEGAGYKPLALYRKNSPKPRYELILVANFVEVFLARQGHSNPVGINYLEKLQLPHLASIYGAMLAGVGYVLMGAGIPLKIPGVLDAYVNHETATYPLYVVGAKEDTDTTCTFVPRDYVPEPGGPLTRPYFLAIIASNTLALTMVKKANGRVDGFVVEGPTAGGHNAPPRGKLQLSEQGEPIYGERDVVDLPKLCEVGLPFWLAGGYGSAGKLREAQSSGAVGIQVGTAFAYCAESGLSDEYRQSILRSVKDGTVRVFTDPSASPTNFPFKVVQEPTSNSNPEVYAARKRVCDLGYLREPYLTPDEAIEYRCASEPIPTYLAKGGKAEDADGAKCLCNGLMANIGMAQVRAGGYEEKGLLTSGDDLVNLQRFLPAEGLRYEAADVVKILLDGVAPSQDSAEVLVQETQNA